MNILLFLIPAQIFEFSDITIGVTGTKGKSTTSSMLYHVLSQCSGRKTFLVGNIGLPCFDYYDEIDHDSIVVFELSCHQLANLTVSPRIAVFLNLYEDHLDYYKTFDNYFRAKKNITVHQSEQDILFYGDSVPDIDTKARKERVLYDPDLAFDMQLKGEHNQYNAQFVYKICTGCFGCADEEFRKAGSLQG